MRGLRFYDSRMGFPCAFNFHDTSEHTPSSILDEDLVVALRNDLYCRYKLLILLSRLFFLPFHSRSRFQRRSAPARARAEGIRLTRAIDTESVHQGLTTQMPEK